VTTEHLDLLEAQLLDVDAELRLLEIEERADNAELAIQGGRGALAAFVRWAWPIVEPGVVLEWSWFLDLLCEEWELFISGKTQDLLINMPPGMMKSLIGSVFVPAFDWLHQPYRRSLYCSGTASVNKRDSRRCRDVIRSDDYIVLAAEAARRRGEEPWTLKKDQSEKLDYANTIQGQRLSVPLGGRIVGQRGNMLVVDDPHDVKEIVLGGPDQVRKRLADRVHIFDKVLPTRLNDQRRDGRAVVMQRLHTDDVSGHCIREGGWRVVVFAMRFNPDNPHNHPKDPRTERGELLDPVRFPEEVLRKLEKRLGPSQAAAQLQQEPRIVEGLRFKREWFRVYKGLPTAIAMACQMLVLSVDCAASKNKEADWTVMVLWGFMRGRRYLLDQIRVKSNYPEQKRALLLMWNKWRNAGVRKLLIENKSNGLPLIDEALVAGMPAIAFNPGSIGSKVDRASYTEGCAEAGLIYIPDEKDEAWVADWVDEHLAFGPGCTHDDMVDATSQVMCHWGKDSGTGDQGLVGADLVKQQFAFLLG